MDTLKVNDKVTIVEDYFDLTDKQDFKRGEGRSVGLAFYTESDLKDKVFTVSVIDADGDIILVNEDDFEVGFFYSNVLKLKD